MWCSIHGNVNRCICVILFSLCCCSSQFDELTVPIETTSEMGFNVVLYVCMCVSLLSCMALCSHCKNCEQVN